MHEIVVISGKGGTGKTTLVGALASLWNNVVTADCDVDASDLHLLFNPDIQKQNDFYSGTIPVINYDLCTQCGRCREVCVFGAISPEFVIDPIACEGCAVCYHFCPEKAITLQDHLCGEWFISDTRFGPFVHARLGIAEDNSGKLVFKIRTEAKIIAEKSNRDTILIDGSPGIGCPVMSSLTGASLAVVVTEPSLSGMHDMKRVLQLIQHFKMPALVVINKFDISQDISRQIEETAQKMDCPVIGKIPYDAAIIQAMVHGQTIPEFSNGELVQNFKSIADAIKNRL